MSAGWLLDSSAIGVADRPPVAERLHRLLRAGALWSCPLLELEALGAAATAADHRALAEDRRVAYRQAAFGAAVGERALALQGRLVRRDRGSAVTARDLLVAATALENELTVLHYDPVFTVLGELTALDEQAVAPLGSLP